MKANRKNKYFENKLLTTSQKTKHNYHTVICCLILLFGESHNV